MDALVHQSTSISCYTGGLNHVRRRGFRTARFFSTMTGALQSHFSLLSCPLLRTPRGACCSEPDPPSRKGPGSELHVFLRLPSGIERRRVAPSGSILITPQSPHPDWPKAPSTAPITAANTKDVSAELSVLSLGEQNPEQLIHIRTLMQTDSRQYMPHVSPTRPGLLENKTNVFPPEYISEYSPAGHTMTPDSTSWD